MPRSAPTAPGLSGGQFDPLWENGMLKWVRIFSVIAVMAGQPPPPHPASRKPDAPATTAAARHFLSGAYTPHMTLAFSRSDSSSMWSSG